VGEPPGLSRRDLFGSGLSRLVARLDGQQQQPSYAEAAPAAAGSSYASRQAEAWDACDGADLWADAARLLVGTAPPAAGERVLDAGAGDGNVALLAARRGAEVTACDQSAALVARGRERTAAAGIEVTWLQADMAALPFADATFDRVLSGLAPMFCLRARDAIAELFRVVRPGGTVAFTVWTQSGVVGRLVRLAATRDPPPAGVPTPRTWGREERLRPELEIYSPTARTELAGVTFEFSSPEEATERLLGALGPLAAVPGDGLREEARAIVVELAGSASGPVQLSAGCLVAIAQRPPRSA